MWERIKSTTKSALGNLWSSPWVWIILTPTALFATDSGRRVRGILEELRQWAVAEFEIFRENLRFYRWAVLYPLTLIGTICLLAGAPTFGTMLVVLSWLPVVLSSIVVGAVANDLKKEGGRIGSVANVVRIIMRPIQIVCWAALMAFAIAFFFNNDDWTKFSIFLLYTEIAMIIAIAVILLGRKIGVIYVLSIIWWLVIPMIYFSVFNGTNMGSAFTAHRHAFFNRVASQSDRKTVIYNRDSLNLIVIEKSMRLYIPQGEPEQGKAMMSKSAMTISGGDTLLVGDADGLEATNGGTGKWIGVYLQNADGVYLGRMYYLPPNTEWHAVEERVSSSPSALRAQQERERMLRLQGAGGGGQTSGIQPPAGYEVIAEIPVHPGWNNTRLTIPAWAGREHGWFLWPADCVPKVKLSSGPPVGVDSDGTLEGKEYCYINPHDEGGTFEVYLTKGGKVYILKKA